MALKVFNVICFFPTGKSREIIHQQHNKSTKTHTLMILLSFIQHRFMLQ